MEKLRVRALFPAARLYCLIIGSVCLLLAYPSDVFGQCATTVTITTPVPCFGGTATVTFTASGGTAPYSYTFNGETNSTGVFSGVSAGTGLPYSVTDAVNCGPVTGTVDVPQPAVLSATVASTNITCFGASDGTITITDPVGGYGTYEYSINGGTDWQAGGSFTGLGPGTFNVQIRDAAHTGCVMVLNNALTLTQPAVLSATVASANISCFGASDGTITITDPVGGYGTYEYSINGGTDWQAGGSFTGLGPGTFNVQIRDAAHTGCVIVLNNALILTQPAVLSATVASTNITCFGASDGTITITDPVGGYGTYEYSINGGTSWQAGGSFTGLGPGTFNVQIRDAAHTGCVIVLNNALILTQPAVLSATVASTNITCFGASDGTITITEPVGGYGTYEYSINGGTDWQSGGSFAGLGPGTFNVQIRDAAHTGCVIVLNNALILTQPAVLEITSLLSNSPICQGTTLNLQVTVAGGTPSYGYLWSGPGGYTSTDQNPVISNVQLTAAGSYQVTVTDNNGCVTDSILTVIIVPTPTVTDPADQVLCNGSGTALITFTGTGTSYLWTNDNASIGLGLSGTGNISSFTAVNTGFDPVIANLTVTPVYTSDGIDCLGSPQTFTITVNPTPVLSSSLTPPAICSGTLFSYTPLSQTVGTTFTWNRAVVLGISNSSASGTGDPGETLTNTTSAPISVTYVYSLTANGCANPATYPVVVVVNPRPTLSSSLTPPAICSNTLFSYAPSSATSGAVFTWVRPAVAGISNAEASGSGNPNETLINTTANSVSVTYIYTITANGCSHTQNVVVSVRPVPVLSSSLTPPSICSGSLFNYTPTSGTSGVVFLWNRGTTVGISNPPASGTGNPNETLISTSADPVSVTYTYTLVLSGCSNTQNIVVTVFPKPVLSSTLTPSAICSNSLFSYTPTSLTTGTTFAWSRAAVAGISNPAGSGTGNPNETLINTTAASVNVTYVYTLTANGCTNTQQVVVRVHPTATLTSSLTPAAICSQTLFSYTPTSNTSGTTFAWSRADIPGIGNPAASGTGNPNEILINTTASPVVVSYSYTLTANGCSNSTPYVVSVTVNPRPVLSSSLTPPAICSGSLFSYLPTSATAGTSFAWTRAAIGGISNPAASGTGDPAENLVNTTSAPINVTYTYTLSANGCTNPNPYLVVVKVDPVPALTSSLTPPGICSNTLFSYTPTSGTSGTAFAWTRGAVAGISNPPASGTGDPMETLVNTTGNPVTVTYSYTLSTASCSNPVPFQVSVIVNPEPVLTSSLTPPDICSNTQFSYTPASNAAGVVFSWSRAALAGISNPASTGTGDPGETLFNTTAGPINVTYVFSLTANGCTSATTYSVVVVVLPVATLTSSLTPPAICSNALFSYTPTSETAGTIFNWSRAAVSGISNPASSGTGDPNEVLISTRTTPVSVTYAYTLLSSGCTNPMVYNVVVLVNPVPVLTSSLTPAAICTNTQFSYTPASSTAGTSFSWQRAAVTGISNPAASGTGNPNETLINTSSDPVTVTYIYILTANGCTGSTTYPVTVSVKPRPTLSSTLTPPAICNNSVFSYTPASATAGTTFVWNRSAVTGISNPPSSGTGDPNETLVNTTNVPVNVTYSYQLSANGCTNPNPYAVVVTVNPTPVLTSTLTPPGICSNTVFSYVPASYTGGTTFAWSRAEVTGISNPAATGTGNPGETLVNTTNAPVSVVYQYTLTANGCTNPAAYSVTVVVSPLPELTSTLSPPAVCSGTVFSYTPTGSVAGTTFNWSRAEVPGISNVATSGSGDPAEALVNTTTAPVSVTYVYTLTAGGCINPTTYPVIVQVNPTPLLTSSLTPPGPCSGVSFSYEPTSATAGTIFNWSRAVVTGISNAEATGTGNPNETLVNTTTGPVSVVYQYTLTANGCSNVQDVTVVVSPVPDFTSTLAPDSVCSNQPFAYDPTSNITGATFTWTRGAIAGISNPATNGTGSVNETLINTTTAPINVTYVFTVAVGACTNPSVYNVVVVIVPSPALTSTTSPPAICSGTLFTYTPTSSSSGVTFAWNRAEIAGISNPAASGTGDPGETLINTTTTTISVTYVYTLIASGCSPAPEYLVTVDVLPTPTLSSSLTPTGICSNTLFSYEPTSDLPGTTFAWSRADIPGISNPAASGTGDPGEYLDNTTGSPIAVTYIYTLTANGCTNIQNVVTMVTPRPALTSDLNPPNVCSSHLFSYEPTSSIPGTSFSWTRAAIAGISNPAGSGTGNISEILLNTTLSSVLVTYEYTLTLNGCSNTTSIQVLVVPAPPVEASASATTICAGTSFDLFSSTSVTLQTIALLNETFNPATNSWTLTNSSTGGTTSRAAWTLRPDNYQEPVDRIRIRSNDQTQFYMSNSRHQNGTVTNTTLTSPSVNTSGYSSLSLSFYHYFRYEGLSNESARVQVSTNGSTWTTVATYTSNQGAATAFTNATINLDSYTGNSTFYIRFWYYANGRARYWAIDNVTVNGTVAPTISWSSVPPGFTSSEANPSGVTQSQTTTYTATYSYPGFTCTGEASVTVEDLVDTDPPVIHNMPPDVTIECQDCIQAFVNADFEENQWVNPWAYIQSVPGNQGVPGWYTTAPRGNMEIQRTGCAPCGYPTSYHGNYHAELNSDEMGDFYQEFCTVPTTTVQVIFQHKKRVPPTPNTIPDVMEVYAGPNLSSLTLVHTASTNNTVNWTTNTVNIPIPVGQNSTIFLFRAKSTSSGNLTYGNLIDDIRAVTLFDPFLIPSATDNCPGVNITINEQRIPGDCSSNYTLIRTWIATDAAGNSTQSTQTVIVGDFKAPVIHGIPADTTVNCQDPVPPIPTVNPTDNCVRPEDVTMGYFETTTPGSCPDHYTITRSWTAEDLCENDTLQSYTITVRDITPPEIFTPAPIVINCGESTLPQFTGMATMLDNCDPDPVLTWRDSITPGFCNGNFVITRTWEATDRCGNSTITLQDIVLQDISVQDTTRPEITLPPAVAVECTESIHPDDIGWATVFDNCDPNPSLSYSDGPSTPGSCLGTSEVLRTWTAVDGCGNIRTSVQVIAIVDTTNPVLVLPADTTISCDASSLPAETGNATATDNCDPGPVITYADVVNPGACTGTTVITRTWTATDDCGNAANGIQTITTIDVEAPDITCPAPATINCDETADPALTGNASATDNCDPAPVITYADVTLPGSEPGSSLITRTWTVTDACGNTNTCVQLITVQDVTPPVVAQPADTVMSCEAVTLPAITGTATATDNCDTSPVISYSDIVTLGSCPGNSVIQRTWTATDLSGNTGSAIQTITLEDTTDPVITCPPDTTITCGSPTDPSTLGIATATDICDPVPLVTYADTETPGACAGDYTITRTWTATDACGNSSTCSQTISIEDSTPPLITCPADTTISCTSSPLPASTGIATATDDCDSDPVVTSADVITPGSCSGTYSISRTWTATDHCGNSSSCVQSIQVVDTLAPVLICPSNVIINCQNSTLPANTGTATASDNCDGAPVVSYSDVTNAGSCPGNYTISRTWSATDACGNASSCTQTITVRDVTAPVITCPPAVTVNIDGSTLPATTGTASATDNCDPAPVIAYSDAITPGTCPGKYTITRTWTATDACNNQSSCNQIITVQDITPPVITCPADQTLACQDPYTPATMGTATAVDDSGLDPAITYADAIIPGICPGNRTVLRTWRATDNCGNFSTCVQTLTIQDLVGPVLTCPTDTTISCDDAVFPSFTGTATAIDACDPAPLITYADSDTPGSCSENYIINRTWTATDACGNISTCVQVITIQDILAPVLICPADLTIDCDQSNDPTLTGEATATDNCDALPFLEYTDNIVPGSCSGNYTISRTWRASDNCGNESTCVQTITVQDITPPAITCPPPVMLECRSQVPAPDISSVSASDNCGGTINIVFVQDISDSGSCPEIITRTYQATDICGNSSVCTQYFIIQDITPPVLTGVPADVTAECQAVPPVVTPTATDNCVASPVIIFTETQLPGSCAGNYTITRTWSVTDDCGNLTEASQIVTVQDIQAPVITCTVSGEQLVLLNTPGQYIHADTSWDASATDNCASPVLTVILTGATISGPVTTLQGVAFNPGLTTVTWTANDGCGNRSSCQFTVNAQVPIDISCAPDILQDTDAGVCMASIDPGVPTLLAGSEPVTWSWVMTGATSASGTGRPVSPNPFLFNTGITRITWTATNISGSDTCSQLITISDLEPPTFTAPPPFEFCVVNLTQAVISSGNLTKNPEPDYFLMKAGDAALDLDPAINLFNDNCCPDDQLTIHWRINFTDTPNPTPPPDMLSQAPISGTGQPSAYGSDIRFPGDGVNFTNIVHTITYWLTDCNGNISGEQSVNITITPRPRLLKLN